MSPERFGTGVRFVDGREPVRVNNHWVYRRALEIEAESARKMWEEANERLDPFRDDTQVVILAPNPQDVTSKLYNTLIDKPLGKYPVAVAQEWEFESGEVGIQIIGEEPCARSIYLVASLVNERDYARVRRVADHYKNDLSAECVSLIATFLGSARSDKNVDRFGSYTPTTINVRAEWGANRGFVDRALAYEPHSKATQAFAAINDIPLLPITPSRFLVDTLRESVEIDPNNTVIVRPDKGRNLAALRMQEHLGLRGVSFEKSRISGKKVEFEELTDDEQLLVRGKGCLMLDDETATFGTIYDLAAPLYRYGALHLDCLVVHGKFAPEWEEKIKHPLIRKVLVTDSRQPIGNLAFSDKVKVATLAPLTYQLIEADIARGDFYSDAKFQEMIL